MTRFDKTRTRLLLTLVAGMAGGSLVTSCQSRVRGAVVDGSKSYLFTLFDPTAFVGLLTGDTQE